MSRTLSNKVVLITGCREGIGFQTALQMASRNWTVLMADHQDLRDAKQTILCKTSNQNIFTFFLDLSSFKSVKTFAKDVCTSQRQLHVLINNAAIFQGMRTTTDHLNPVMQVNHLGPFLLTVLLTDLLKKSSPSRIIFLASSGAFLHNLEPTALPILDKGHHSLNILDRFLTYYNSKLCNMIICKQLAEKLRNYGITSNCLHPGMTSSNFLLRGNLLKYVSPISYKMLQLVTQDPEKSADLVTFLATSKTLSQVTGKYFVNYQANQMPKIVDDSDYCEKLWSQAEKVVNLTEEEKQIFK